MVARIRTSQNMGRVLHYNEHKVQSGEAEFLHGENFIKDAGDLTVFDKINLFKKFTSLNERTATNTLHVSLNFDPSETFDNEKLIAIARTYMDRIGFGGQPYLIYRHHDAGHPHIHIVSTNIKNDGSRISMHNLGRDQSEKARKAIEIEFGLVKAQGKKLKETSLSQPISAQKIVYGKSSTKRAISNVLGIVINQYKFCSLPELNAVLGLYNVTAEKVMTDGLIYQVIDSKGKKISAPIKASAFYMKPIFANLQLKYAENEKLKIPHARRVRTAIDFALLKANQSSLQGLIKALEKEQISTVLRQNKDGVIYGITYVDHRTKCVFNGSDLGKPYSAKQIIERCSAVEKQISPALADEKKNIILAENSSRHSSASPAAKLSLPLPDMNATPAPADYMPYQLRRNKRKRKKKRLKL